MTACVRLLNQIDDNELIMSLYLLIRSVIQSFVQKQQRGELE